MASFSTDHNVALRVATLLRERGHAAVTARDLGLERAGDDEHLLVCAERGWILVTDNEKDFALLHDAWRRWATAWRASRAHAGILVCPQSWLADRVAQELRDFLAGGYPLHNAL